MQAWRVRRAVTSVEDGSPLSDGSAKEDFFFIHFTALLRKPLKTVERMKGIEPPVWMVM
jgi:hypothetical protein